MGGGQLSTGYRPARKAAYSNGLVTQGQLWGAKVAYEHR